MGIEDRDWYRKDYARKTATNTNPLNNIVTRTENRQRTSKLAMALIWIAVIAALYYAFTVATQLTH